MVINLSSQAERVENDKTSEYLKAFHWEIAGFGSWKKTGGRIINDFVVSEYELSCLRKGRLRIVTPENSYLCESGALFLFEPFVPYSVEKLYDGDMNLFNLFFDIYPEYRHTEFISRILRPGIPVWHAGEIPDLSGRFEEIYEQCAQSPQGKEVLVESLLKTCLVYMLRARQNDSTPQDEGLPPSIVARENAVVRQGIRFIREHLSEPIKLYDLCDELNISESYLYKCFRNITHVSPQRYILQYKVKKAQQMLKFQGVSLEEAAGLLGFSSSYHLSGTFKKILGKSPRNHLKASPEDF